MIKHHSMSEQIRTALADRIYTGVLQPGDRLIELQIAKEFATSQAPVREAFRALETMSLIETQPYKGSHVRKVSPREMAEAYTVRGMLEQFAAELIGDKLIGKVQPLRVSIEGIRSAAVAGSHELYTQHNLDFHRWIVTAADNSVLLRSWEALEFENRMRINVARAEQHNLVERVQIHVDIADAFDSGDSATAGHLLREHAQQFGESWKTAEAPEVTMPTMAKTTSRKKGTA